MNGVAKAMDKDYKKNGSVKWNFTKFLIGRDGQIVGRFEPTTSMKALRQKIEEVLLGNTCGRRPTSCADQLAKAVRAACQDERNLIVSITEEGEALKEKAGYLENVGFLFQQMDLLLQSMGLGVCWLGMGKPDAKAIPAPAAFYWIRGKGLLRKCDP